MSAYPKWLPTCWVHVDRMESFGFIEITNLHEKFKEGDIVFEEDEKELHLGEDHGCVYGGGNDLLQPSGPTVHAWCHGGYHGFPLRAFRFTGDRPEIKRKKIPIGSCFSIPVPLP